MMLLKGRIDPQKVANLDEPDCRTLYRAADMIVLHQQLPPELQAKAFRLMQKCGARVMHHDCMLIASLQLQSVRQLVDNLRRFI